MGARRLRAPLQVANLRAGNSWDKRAITPRPASWPVRPDLLILGASAYRTLDALERARDDSLRTIALAEGTPVADSARANLEKLDVKVE